MTNTCGQPVARSTVALVANGRHVRHTVDVSPVECFRKLRQHGLVHILHTSISEWLNMYTTSLLQPCDAVVMVAVEGRGWVSAQILLGAEDQIGAWSVKNACIMSCSVRCNHACMYVHIHRIRDTRQPSMGGVMS